MLKTEKFVKKAGKEAEKLGVNNYLMVVIDDKTGKVTVSKTYNETTIRDKNRLEDLERLYNMCSAYFNMYTGFGR